MDKDKALERLNKAIEYLKDNGQARNQTDMATLMGIRQPHLAAAINGDYKRLTEGLLKKFATAYSDYIYMDWLLTGEGKMAKPLQELRPHIQAKAAAGFMSAISESEYGDDKRPMILGIPEYDFSITVDGKSMEPKIEDNDILACRIMTDNLNPPVGKICVIDSKDGVAVKIIKEIEEDCIVLHSLNPKYKDYRVSFSDLNQIALVVGLIRSF